MSRMDVPKISQIAMLVAVNNFSQVELYGQIRLRANNNDPYALIAIAWANLKADLLYHSQRFLRLAENCQNKWPEVAAELSVPDDDWEKLFALHQQPDSPQAPDTISLENRYLVIKAWGYGFWSDMLHVIGGLMLAEITKRQPVVHWGANSLYSTGEDINSFTDFFQPIGPDIESLILKELNCYPPKWKPKLLSAENNDKTKGEWSKISGLHLMGRNEPICVMDYYIGVLNLMPYLPENSEIADFTIDQIYAYLIQKYLKLNANIVKRANQFYQEHFASSPYLAVHVRGSDKVGEFKVVDKFHNKYQQLISQQLEQLPGNCKIFLMTDDTRLLKNYLDIFGDRIVTTDCLRTDNQIGIHYQAQEQVKESANEVIVDTLIASRASRFVGNGYSNPSIFVYYLGKWKNSECLLIGGNRMHHYNTHLYKTINVV
ncbi:MAG: O-fucosyltransferase family protein [Acidiferrobacterales bacterium]|nr:O-fucosyltransferase family protein [Acidiferrobacterales bacterium]